MRLVGAKHDVERAAEELGYADRPTISTDMIFVGLGIFFGDWSASHGNDRRPAHYAHGQRRRPDHGIGVWLPSVRASTFGQFLSRPCGSSTRSD